MVFEIHKDRFGEPYLKRVDRMRYPDEPRGKWVEIGNITQPSIDKIIRLNKKRGYLVLMDEDGIYRTLILTD